MSPRAPAEPLRLPKQARQLRESDIEDRVCRYAREQGLLAYKFTSPNRRSVPDRLFASRGGHVFFAEFKAPGKKPTVAQKREIARLRQVGCLVYVIDDVAMGKRVIDENV